MQSRDGAMLMHVACIGPTWSKKLWSSLGSALNCWSSQSGAILPLALCNGQVWQNNYLWCSTNLTWSPFKYNGSKWITNSVVCPSILQLHEFANEKHSCAVHCQPKSAFRWVFSPILIQQSRKKQANMFIRPWMEGRPNLSSCCEKKREHYTFKPGRSIIFLISRYNGKIQLCASNCNCSKQKFCHMRSSDLSIFACNLNQNGELKRRNIGR